MFRVKTNHRKLFVYTLFQMKTSHCWPKPEIWSISLASAATSPKQYLASVRDDAVSEEGVLALKFVTRYFSIRSLHRLVCSSACNTPSNFCRCFTRSLRVYGVFFLGTTVSFMKSFFKIHSSIRANVQEAIISCQHNQDFVFLFTLHFRLSERTPNPPNEKSACS